MNDSDNKTEVIPLQEMEDQSIIVSLEDMAENTSKQQKLSFLPQASTFAKIRFFYIAVILNIYISIVELLITQYMDGILLWGDISIDVSYICFVAFLSLLLLILTNAFLHISSYVSYMPGKREIAAEVTLFITSIALTRYFVINYANMIDYAMVLLISLLFNAIFIIFFTLFLIFIMDDAYKNRTSILNERRMSKKWITIKYSILYSFWVISIFTILICVFHLMFNKYDQIDKIPL